MAASFKDPQEELRFINEMEVELSRLVVEGLIREEDIAGARQHYANRRSELESALLSRSSRLLPTGALAHRGTVTWIAWVGVALVLVATLVFVSEGWEALGPAGRMTALLVFTTFFYGGSWYLYARTGLRRTGLAVLTLATGMIMVDIGYFAEWRQLGYSQGFGSDIAFLVFGVGCALFVLWSWQLDEPILSYLAIGCAFAALNAAIDWGFSGWIEQLGVEEPPYNDEAWDAMWYIRGWWTLVLTSSFGALLGTFGWLWGHAKGWRHATPLLFSGILIFLISLVTMPDNLIPTNADGFLALFAALVLLWVGLASQRLPVSVASTIGLAAAIIRIEVEFFDDFLFRTLTLLILGIAIIALAVIFERRRREILDRLGTWE